MKILIATGIYPPSIGGPATYSKLLFNELPLRGHEVSVLSFDSVRHMPKIVRHFKYFQLAFKMAKDADVVYAQDPVSVGLPALFAAKMRGKKFVLKVVGDYAWEQGTQRCGVVESLDTFSAKKSGYPLLVVLLKTVQSFVATHADRTIVPSNYLKNVVTNWGVEPKKISVVYNAFEGVEDPGGTSERHRATLGVTGTVITSVGRLVPWKGFKTLIDVVKDLKNEVPDIKLLIIGDGPDMADLKKYIIRNGVEDTVMMAGKLPKTELFSYIKASDVFVLNTQYEGFSHQLLEVMALGTPIVTTKAGGNVELIEHGTNGLLVEYNDKLAIKSGILSLIKLQDERKKMVNNAQEKVKGFTKERMLNELMEELENCVKSTKRHGK